MENQFLSHVSVHLTILSVRIVKTPLLAGEFLVLPKYDESGPKAKKVTMNDQSPINTSEPEPTDRRETRRQRRAERLADPSRGGAWIAGLILILLGGIFLLRNTGTFDIPLRNWWALFILIPAIGSLDTALRIYRSSGNQLTAPARGSLLVGLVLTFVTAAFIFELNCSYFGPILIILTGIGILFTYMLGNRE